MLLVSPVKAIQPSGLILKELYTVIVREVEGKSFFLCCWFRLVAVEQRPVCWPGAAVLLQQA